jgi:hypothetical protein
MPRSSCVGDRRSELVRLGSGLRTGHKQGGITVSCSASRILSHSSQVTPSASSEAYAVTDLPSWS